MSRTSLWDFCKEAGPIGPGLWLFDNLIEGLSADPTESTMEPIADEETDDWGLMIVLAIIGVVVGGCIVLSGLARLS